MTASPCPPKDRLLALLEGNLTDSDESQLLLHLDNCASCQQFVEQDSAETPLPDALEDTRRSRIEPQFRELIERIKSPAWVPPNSNLEPFEPSNWTDERFELLEELGRGGMGVVYLAHEKSLDRKVAIKFLAPHLASQVEARQRFVREAKAAAAIRDSGAITVHSVSDSSPPFIVMEYVEGETLQSRIERGSIELEEAISIASQIARVLDHAHSIKVLHRDIKPANVLLDNHTHEAKLTDFGLAQIAGESKLTQSGMLIGTPAYMAPELLELRQDVDGRADLFSLGVLLYAMLTGQSPFESGSILSTIRNVAALDAPSLQQLRPEVPAWLAQLVSVLLEKEPEDRPASAAEVLDRLETRELLSSVRPDNRVPTNSASNVKLTWQVVGIGLMAIASILLIATMWIKSQNTDPFHVRSDDGLVQFSSLAEALAESPDGATIEIHSEGPFLLQETRLAKELSIVAAPGLRPRILFDSANRYEGTMLTTNSSLTLDGLELAYAPEDDADDAYTLIRLDGGNLEIRNCLLKFSGEEGCCLSVDLDPESNLSLTDSLLSAWPGESINIAFRDDARAHFENCMIAGTTCFDVETFGDGQMHLDGCRVVGENFLTNQQEDEETGGQIVVHATNNAFHLFESLADIGEFDEEYEYEPPVQLQGHDNRFALPPQEADDLKEWIGEVGTLVPSVFAQRADEVLRGIQRPDSMQFHSFNSEE